MGWLLLYVAYLITFVSVPAYVVISNKLPPASSFIILMEQLRMLMKTYAFIRSNIPRALKNGKSQLDQLNINSLSTLIKLKISLSKKIKKNFLENNFENKATHFKKEHDSDDENEMLEQSKEGNILCPEFSRYLYFLFAPTLVYKDAYPRYN